MMSFDHGWQACRACYAQGQDLRVEGEWHLRANPGYWGSSSPRVLVLGFSKGANQTVAAISGGFDGVAFAKMRPRLQQVLDTLAIDLEGQTLDQALSAEGRVLGAASLIRCGLSLMENGKLLTSGAIMPKAARNPFTRHVMATCVARHLDPIPESVQAVILLGTTDTYIKGVKDLMRSQFSDYRDINDVAFSAQSRIWVFAAHPSPANGEFGKWVTGDPSTASGCKRVLALQALGKIEAASRRSSGSIALAAPPATAPSSRIGNKSSIVHPQIAVASTSVRQAESVIAREFERIKTGNKKVAGFQTKLGRHLALQRDVRVINVWTEDLEPPEQFASCERYPAHRSRNSNLASQAPRVANDRPARLWRLENVDQLEALIAWYANA